MANFTTFKGFDNIGDSSLEEIINTNLKYFLDWGFLDKGAYFNVDIPTSGAFGGEQSRLRPVRSPYYSDGQVWEAFRSDWVWESGIQGQPIQPTQVSGVFVGNTFYSVGSNHHVDYINGQIVFDSAISTTSEVKVEYSYRWIHTYNADDLPWFNQVQQESFIIEDNFLSIGSGDRAAMAQTRIQLPAVAYEFVDGNYKPYQIGLGQYAYNDVIFHVIAEDKTMASKIADYLSQQNEKTIFLFNVDTLADSGGYPLDYQGSIAAGAMTYPQLVQAVEDGGYRWRKMRFFKAKKQKTNKISKNLFIKPVRITTEVVLPNI